MYSSFTIDYLLYACKLYLTCSFNLLLYLFDHLQAYDIICYSEEHLTLANKSICLFIRIVPSMRLLRLLLSILLVPRADIILEAFIFCFILI
jgi:hypothetical protein